MQYPSTSSSMRRRPCVQSGFTLIEISITLVIVALLVAGVFVGREMIEVAQNRRLMSQMEGFQVAANTFKLKYNCKAGDCAKAASFNLGTSGNGDGLNGCRSSGTTNGFPGGLYGSYLGVNGCIGDVPGDAAIYMSSIGEHQLFWAHLSAAGLIKENILPNAASSGVDQIMAVTYPKDAMGRHYMHTLSWNNRFYIHTGLETADPTFSTTKGATSATFSAAQMQYIALKFNYPILVGAGYPPAFLAGQKVVPMSGYVYAYLPPEYAGTASPACVVSDGAGGYRYNTANNGRCDFLWEIDY